MATYTYPSVFDSGPAIAPSGDNAGAESKSGSAELVGARTSEPAENHNLASFVCHLAALEENLSLERGSGDDSSLFIGAKRVRIKERQRLGTGLSFVVDRAEMEDSTVPGAGAGTKSKTIVIKTVRENQNRQGRWQDVLLEIRALLHKPVRYHPNIVRLLDIHWDASSETGSSFPTLIQEYAAFGTLDKLQMKQPPLPFRIKQKLCYDVGRGLSIIHACGMVHGDLKHENILIFANRYSKPYNQPYTAKIGDFGATIMDMGGNGTYRVRMHTFPFEAPESNEELSREDASKIDAFSFGMLVWRCMIDCKDILKEIGFHLSHGKPTENERETMHRLKLSSALLKAAIQNVTSYFKSRGLPTESLRMVRSAMLHTMEGDPKQRSLARAQARLRGMNPATATLYAVLMNGANEEILEADKNSIPGQSGMNVDQFAHFLGSMGYDYDAHNNLPGFRPNLPHPQSEGFLFIPLKFRRLLHWWQQEQMVRDFETAANSTKNEVGLNLVPSQAAFYLYQAYLCGFGTTMSAEKACNWLRLAYQRSKAASPVYTDCYVQAWLSRVHSALGVSNPHSAEQQIQNLACSLKRGFSHCRDDAEVLIDVCTNEVEKQTWKARMEGATRIYRQVTSSTGKLLFESPMLIGNWKAHHATDIDLLDKEIKRSLGSDYDSCLREHATDETAAMQEKGFHEGRYIFDRLYVNSDGHSLLHMAASFGNINVLRHLHRKYLCDINLRNQSHGDTALICACRSGNLECAMYCLEAGAEPDGSFSSQEPPLHCISSFDEPEMNVIVAKLLGNGADMEKTSEPRGKLLADWEGNLKITTTPLGRAVIKQSLQAVKVLLRNGADPTAKSSGSSTSPVELAAVLTLPDILDELLQNLNDRARGGPESPHVFDEGEMLKAARSGKITEHDSVSLQSRIIRCGVYHKAWLRRTIRTLNHQRRLFAPSPMPEQARPAGYYLCLEIEHGNLDTTSALLEVGHPVEGSVGYRPIQAAVAENNSQIFLLLVQRGSALSFPEDRVSLLHLLANRQKHTPTDLTIAEYLLDKVGIPASPECEKTAAPLLQAIKGGYYNLADLLISKGAGISLNMVYNISESVDSYSLLGDLVRSPTFSSLQAIKYLAYIHRRDFPSLKVSPLASRSSRGTPVSAIHAMALSPFTDWNNHNQVSASILQCVLEMFPGPESLGDLAVDQDGITPLGRAVMTAHSELFLALMSTAYQCDWNKVVQLRGEFSSSTEQIRLVELAERLVWEEIYGLQNSKLVTEDDISLVKRRVEIAKHLLTLQDDLGLNEAVIGTRTVSNPSENRPSAPLVFVDFQNAIQGLTNRMATERSLQIEYLEDAEDPVDLSILNEESPMNLPGVDEDTESNAQALLKIFRGKAFPLARPTLNRIDALLARNELAANVKGKGKEILDSE